MNEKFMNGKNALQSESTLNAFTRKRMFLKCGNTFNKKN